jgi:diguanylate cyclase (GGDEF)-like protein/PAS domain S-box-containing protein
MAQGNDAGRAQTALAGADAGAVTPALGPDELLRVVESAVNPFCAIDPSGTVVWAGASMQELLGWDPADLVGRSMLELVAPGSLQHALEALDAASDYLTSRDDEPTTWEGVGPVIELVCADGSTVHSAVAVATPVRTGLPVFVLQLRRADSARALEEALVAMGRGDPISAVLGRLAAMLAGELPEADVAIAHRCTADDQVEVIGAPPGLAGVFEPGIVAGTPWQATAEDPDTLVDHATDALPEPFRSTARAAGYRWLTTVGVRAAGPGQHRAFVAVWSRHPYASHVFSHQRLRRCAGLVGLVVQWDEGRRALTWAATHDVLTGLPNRSTFVSQLNGERRAGPEESDRTTAVLYLDLDDFKPVNDRHGHALGDRVLAEVATRLRHAVRPTDLVARLGGDEFAVLCPSIDDLAAAGALAGRLVEAVSQPLRVGDLDVQVGLSVGIAALVEGDGPDEVLDRADAALRAAKVAGKRQWLTR